MAAKVIKIRGARVHNLRDVDVEIPRGKLVVMTGISGSGKSSLAFDTVYAEGQRRYVESLSTYARQFLGVMDKPDVDSIEGLSPAISIDQRTTSANVRSTVGTITEIYDHLRLMFARVGRVFCPHCGEEIFQQSKTQIIDAIAKGKSAAAGRTPEVTVLAPLGTLSGEKLAAALAEVKHAGYHQVRLDGKVVAAKDVESGAAPAAEAGSTVDVVVGKVELDRSRGADREDLAKAVDLALDLGNGQLAVLDGAGGERRFSEHYTCAPCGFSLPALEPRNFSFNSPAGACSACLGLGTRLEVDADLVIPNRRLTFDQGAIKPWARSFSSSSKNWQLLDAVAKASGFDLSTPVEKLPAKAVEVVMRGTGAKRYAVGGPSGSGAGTIAFPGVAAILEKKHRDTSSDYLRKDIEQYMRQSTCHVCDGRRLKPEALAVRVLDKTIADVAGMTIGAAIAYFGELAKADTVAGNGSAKKAIARQIVSEVSSRLRYLADVGLGYLTLDRPSTTLAGGEAQRIKLATQLGLSLTGVLYILDEPSVGLHQRDNERLIGTMQHLRDLDNTVIVVEHDEMTMDAADYLIDIGPGAGANGGQVVAQGTPAEVRKVAKSVTGRYLAGDERIEAPDSYRKGNGKSIEILGASEFNLKDVDVKIPLGKLVCFTGVSGSGKSTLMYDILAKALAAKFYRAKEKPGAHREIKGIDSIDKVISIDQSPIGRTPRSNPATYTGLFTYIRDLFASSQEAKIRGYGVGKFSFNAKGGRCEACAGDGQVKIEMQFLPDVYVVCEECRGKRYLPEVLEIHYRGKNIAEVLEMSVEEAMTFFRSAPIIYQKLKTLNDVGLGYVKLGQPATTLSGGEAQRVKLATELSRRSTGKTLYVLDEPTSGLHADDIKRLLGVLSKLVDKGNTVLIIEHNLDVIKSADWIIDMGPEGGDGGGTVVAEGTPRDVAKVKKSHTGKFLAEVLKKK